MHNIPFSLEQLAHWAKNFPGPESRLAGLAKSLDAVEEQLEHLQAQYGLRTKASLRKDGQSLHPDDIKMEIHAAQYAINDLFPKIFRGGYIISLWSVFEACVKDMAEYTRKTKNIPLVFKTSAQAISRIKSRSSSRVL